MSTLRCNIGFLVVVSVNMTTKFYDNIDSDTVNWIRLAVNGSAIAHALAHTARPPKRIE